MGSLYLFEYSSFILPLQSASRISLPGGCSCMHYGGGGREVGDGGGGGEDCRNDQVSMCLSSN